MGSRNILESHIQMINSLGKRSNKNIVDLSVPDVQHYALTKQSEWVDWSEPVNNFFMYPSKRLN